MHRLYFDLLRHHMILTFLLRLPLTVISSVSLMFDSLEQQCSNCMDIKVT
jgi:hypothetical protein